MKTLNPLSVTLPFVHSEPIGLPLLSGEVYSMEEEWKNIEGYNGMYQISSLGRVKSFWHKNVIIMKSGMRSKYKIICLDSGTKRTMFQIHRLVGIYFIPNPENKPQINHKDGDRLNNNVNNLEWNTCAENIQHSLRVLKRPLTWKNKFGKDNYSSKRVNQLTLDGELIKTWDSMSDIYRELGIYSSQVSGCCIGRKDFKTAKGFKFQFA